MQIESIAYAIVYVLFGLVIGSFLNVCIYRIPLGKSVVSPGSSCPHCGTPIRFYDNVPVLSFLLLGAKCRSCRNPISLQYPFVELLTGAAFYFCWRVWQFTPPTFVNSLFLSIIIVLVFTDYHHQVLPNKLTLPGAVAGILLSPFQTPNVYGGLSPWIGSILGVAIGGGFLFVVAFGYEKLRKRQGLGMGDVKMMAMVGAFLGWHLSLLTIFAGCLLGTFVGIFLMLFRHGNLQTKLAFGVYLGIGSTFCLFYGFEFLRWYWSIPR